MGIDGPTHHRRDGISKDYDELRAHSHAGVGENATPLERANLGTWHPTLPGPYSALKPLDPLSGLPRQATNGQLRTLGLGESCRHVGHQLAFEHRDVVLQQKLAPFQAFELKLVLDGILC